MTTSQWTSSDEIKLRASVNELAVERADFEADSERIAGLKGRTLEPKEREQLSFLAARVGIKRTTKDGTDVSTGRYARIAELETCVAELEARRSSTDAVAAREADRQVLKNVHAEAMRDVETDVSWCQAWLEQSIAAFSKRLGRHTARVDRLSQSLQRLTCADPNQYHALMEHIVPIVRGHDNNFRTALSHAMGQILEVAVEGKVTPPNRMFPPPSFDRVAQHNLRILNARFDDMHARVRESEPPKVRPVQITVPDKDNQLSQVKF